MRRRSGAFAWRRIAASSRLIPPSRSKRAHVRSAREFRSPRNPEPTRVSADGKLAATTVFVTGHWVRFGRFLHADAADRCGSSGSDRRPREVLGHRAGRTDRQRRLQFLGRYVPRRQQHVLRDAIDEWAPRAGPGNIAGRTAEVVHENVECPVSGWHAGRVQEALFAGWEDHVAAARARPGHVPGNISFGGAERRRPTRMARRIARPLFGARERPVLCGHDGRMDGARRWYRDPRGFPANRLFARRRSLD